MIVVQWSDWIHVRRKGETDLGGKKIEREKEKERERKQNITQLEN